MAARTSRRSGPERLVRARSALAAMSSLENRLRPPSTRIGVPSTTG
jgi:hypothetical protein